MKGFKDYIKDYIKEGRPKLVKFSLKLKNKRWSLKNLETGEQYYMVISEHQNPVNNIHAFLSNINAYDEESLPRTNEIINHNTILQQLQNNGQTVFWVPQNRINNIKKTWEFESEVSKTIKDIKNKNV